MGINRDCLYCSKRFEARMERRLFCTDVCRARYNRETQLTCFYCGSLATTRDHIFPQSARYNGRSIFEDQETVNACSECNSTIGDKEPANIILRIHCLIQLTRKKYQLYKIIPEWSDEELNSIGYSLRKMIAGKIRARQKAIERVMHMRGVWRKIVLLTDEIPADNKTHIV